VRNNTCYNNNTRDDDASWRGEVGIADASDISLINNIAVCNTKMGFTNSGHNTGLFVGQADGYICQNIVWANNQTYNLADPNDSARKMENGALVSLLTDNLFGCDPLFVHPSTDSAAADFRLQNNSSAVNSGTDAYGAASLDLDGNQREIGVIDRGAYESSSTAGPAPCEGPVNQVVVASQPATIGSQGPLDITVDYLTDGDANLLAILFDADWEWITTGMVRVSEGSGTEVINAPISSDLNEGTHHILISLRDLNDTEKASISTSVEVVSYRYDVDGDGDVDGSDLFNLILGSSNYDLNKFAREYGHSYFIFRSRFALLCNEKHSHILNKN
jgi:hypothetical protein